MIVTTIIINVLLSLTVVCELDPSSIPYIINQDEQMQYVMENEKILLTCDIRCLNCTEKEVRVEWEKDDRLLTSSTLVNITNTTLVINSFQFNQHNGSYACIVKYKTLGIRSRPWHLYNIKPPKFVLENHETSIHDTVVFKCIDITSHYRDRLEIQWLKDGKYLQNSEGNVYGSEVLVIRNTLASHIGHYMCKYKFKNTVHWYQSRNVILNITADSESSQPYISHVTKSETVKFNKSIVISCIARNASTIVRIFRVSKNNFIEIKLAENTGTSLLPLTQFGNDQAGTYICEAELHPIRARREIKLYLALKPDFKVHGLTHLDSKTGSKIALNCKPNFASDFNAAWYHNGFPIGEYISPNGVWLTLSELKTSHSGIYQCIVQNKHGSDSKMFYLSVENSGRAPSNLQVTKISPVMVRLSWESSTPVSNVFFQVIWIAPNGHVEENHTNETEYIIDQKLYGGLLYRFEVCTLHLLEEGFRDCVSISETMLELPPSESPRFEIPLIDKNVIKLKWLPIPHKSSLGIIQNYTIFRRQLFSSSVGHLKSFNVNGNETSFTIPFIGISIYKIWMIGTNRAGQSPNSSLYVVTTNMAENGEAEVKLLVKWKLEKWGNRGISYIPRLKWQLLSDPKNITHFKIFYVQFPYKKYWNSVKTVTVKDKSKRQIDLLNLTYSKTYRLTIAPVYKFVNEFKEITHYYGKRTNIILHKDMNFDKSFKKDLHSHNGEIDAPNHLKCFGVNRNSIFISWDPPQTEYPIENYIVYIKSEKGTVETEYSVLDSHLELHNLTDTWYIVRVHAYNEQLKNSVTFFETGYISCRTKISVPSAPQNVSYSVVYVHMDEGRDKQMFLVVKWAPPVYTGESIYSYHVSMKENAVGIYAKFPFTRKVYHVLMEEGSDGWIYSVPMMVSPSVKVEIEITPINDVGQGKSTTIGTSAIFKPSFRSEHRTTAYPQVNSSVDINSGIIVGIAVSAFFLLIFIIVFILKEPFKRRKEKSHARNGSDDSYLYLERLKILPEESLTSQRTFSTDHSTYSSRSRYKKGSACNGYNLMKPSLDRFIRRSRNRENGLFAQQDVFSSSSSSSCNYNNILSRMCCDVDRGPLCCSKCRQNNGVYGSSASEKRDSKDSMVKISATNSSSKITNQDSTTSTSQDTELVGACSLLYKQADL